MTEQNVTVNELMSRLQRQQTEREVERRKRKDEAEAAYNALSQIRQEDVDRLAAIVPELAIIKKYSVDDILKNQNGEIQAIIDVRQRLIMLADERLRFYEERLQ